MDALNGQLMNASGSPDDRAAKALSNINSSGSPDDRSSYIAQPQPSGPAPRGAFAGYKTEDRLVTTQVLNPEYTKWQTLGGANDTLLDIHDRRDEATMRAQAPPPKYTTKQAIVQVKVPRVPLVNATAPLPLVASNGIVINIARAAQPAPAPPPANNLNSGISRFMSESGNGGGKNQTAGEQANAFRKAMGF